MNAPLRRIKLNTLLCLGLMIIATIISSCKEKHEGDSDPDLIARVGKQRLMRHDLDKALALGLPQDDSIRLARAFVRSWIDARIMGELASRNIPDMTEIDRMVEEYRNQLIAWEYRRLMFLHNAHIEFNDDSIASYYARHADDYILERPVIKGVYIKIEDKSPSLPTVKKLYRSRKDADIDRLDKEDFKGVMHYDYFRDRWVDWEQIETRIPLKSTTNPDAFLASNDHIEVSQNGFTYLLEISEFRRTGARMPIEIAEERIRRDLFNT
ncbi:MAG: hypothetical protein K2G40_05210, partial [Muribaculaceae bacterium]|nr:hypothetical protein [Muribaculaceae bacterium]